MKTDIATAELAEAREKLNHGDAAGCLAACVRARKALAESSAPDGAALRALEIYLRASAQPEAFGDPAELRSAADVLAGEGAWEDAMNAWGLLAHAAADRHDHAAVRLFLSSAIGCAEAGSALWFGAALLHRLALAELRAGNAERAGRHASRARARLEGVPGQGAHLTLAACLATLGDAHAALGDRTEAEACWRDALDREEALGRTSVAAGIREKLSRG